MECIPLIDTFSLSDEIIQTFIDFVQLVPISITNDNVSALNYLSKQYEVSKLLKITNDYILSHHSELALPILISNQFDSSFQTDTYEDIIADQFPDYINDDRLLNLQFPILYRIIEKFSKDEKKRQKTGKFLLDFLFKCLDKFGRQASALFQFADFGDSRPDYLNKLFGQYHSIFDFHFINSEFSKTLYENQNQLLQKNANIEQILIKQNEYIENVKNEKDLKISKLEEEVSNHKNEIKQLNQRIESIERKFEEQSKLLIQCQQELSKFTTLKNIEENKEQIKFTVVNCSEGVIKYLTKNCGGNVADKGVVKLTASSLYDNGDSYPLKSIVDIDIKNTSFVSGNKPNSWVKYDFVDKRIHPTHYLIRSAHNNGKGSCNMVSWVCEGSNTDEENDWTILASENDVTYLDSEGAYHKFEITASLQQNECFRYLRIRQTQLNANKSNYLVISALEFYGSIIS